jgi:hypothetical protein
MIVVFKAMLKVQSKQDEKGTNSKQIVDEACNDARNYKMTTMPSLKLAKLIKEEERKREIVLNVKLCFTQPK